MSLVNKGIRTVGINPIMSGVSIAALLLAAGVSLPTHAASSTSSDSANAPQVTSESSSTKTRKNKREAQSGKGEEAPRTLQAVEVSATTFDESIPLQLGKYGNQLSIIDGGDITANNIVDAVTALQMMAPGLTVVPLNGPFSYVNASMYGSQTGEILWLVDGVRINNRLYASTTPLDTIPAAMIDHIEVLSGGQSLFFGTTAVAGAVNIVTKDFLSNGSDGSASVGMDSHAGRHISAFARTASGRNEFVVYGSADSSNGYVDVDPADYGSPPPAQRDRGYDVKSVGVKYRYVMGNSSLTLNYMHNDAHLDLAAPELIYQYYNQRKEDLGSAKLNWEPSRGFAVFVRGYLHRWDSHVTEIDQVVGGYPGELAIEQPRFFWGYRDKGLNVQARIRPGGYFDYYVGYDYQNYGGQDQSLQIGRHSEHVNAVIANIRTSPEEFKKLHLSVGARYNKPGNGAGGTTIWNVSGRYDISPSLFVRSALGTAFELPDAEELFQIDPCCAVGNPKLAPQTSQNFNADLGGHFNVGGSYFTWEAGVFARRVRNLISTAATPDGRQTFVNTPGVTKIKGFQTILTASFGNGFSASGSFTSSISSTGAASGAAAQTTLVNGIPRTAAKFEFSWKPDSLPFGGSLLVDRVGTIYTVPLIQPEPFANYWLVDLSGYWSFGPGSHQEITARIDNLTNRRYVSNYNAFFPFEDLPAVAFRMLGPSRTYYVTYRYNF